MAHNAHHHKGGHGLHILGHLICLINAIAAINWGLKPLGYNLVEYVGNYAPALVNPLYYIIGVSGVIGLIFFFVKLSDSECRC